MRHERDMAMIRGVYCGEKRQVERSGVNGVKRLIDRPLEPRNPRQVRQRGRRRKAGEEFREIDAVLVEPSALRRLRFDKGTGGALKERPAYKAVDRRIDPLERGRQIADERVAVDVQPGFAGDPVGDDMRGAGPSSPATKLR